MSLPSKTSPPAWTKTPYLSKTRESASERHTIQLCNNFSLHLDISAIKDITLKFVSKCWPLRSSTVLARFSQAPTAWFSSNCNLPLCEGNNVDTSTITPLEILSPFVATYWKTTRKILICFWADSEVHHQLGIVRRWSRNAVNTVAKKWLGGEGIIQTRKKLIFMSVL